MSGLRRIPVSMLLLTAMMTVLFLSCEKSSPYDTDGPDKPDTPVTPTDTTTNPVTPTPTDTATENDYISVATAIAYAERVSEDTAFVPPSFIGILGYVVGTVDGTSLSAARFAPPFTSSSNILIADSPYETDVTVCMPVQLKAGSEERTELNLHDHPDNLGRGLVLSGVVTDYFRTYGIKPLYGFAWTDTGGVTPAVPDNPRISYDPRVIEGGR